MDLAASQKALREMTVTRAMAKANAEITGDYNPLHFDKDFAGKTRLERLISQVAVTTGLLHALAATDMPGPGTVFLGRRWSFPRPVYSQCKSGTPSRRRQR